MYIIKTGLGFVGCQSINQSEFNYQACDGKRRQALALLNIISCGAAATKHELERVCVLMWLCGERGGLEQYLKSATLDSSKRDLGKLLGNNEEPNVPLVPFNMCQHVVTLFDAWINNALLL